MKKTSAKKSMGKKSPARKRTKKAKVTRPYVEPKTAAELGMTCLSPVDSGKCGAPVIWFDYEIGDKEFYKGFVCDAHRVSNRVEKLAQPQAATATA